MSNPIIARTPGNLPSPRVVILIEYETLVHKNLAILKFWPQLVDIEFFEPPTFEEWIEVCEMVAGRGKRGLWLQDADARQWLAEKLLARRT